MPKMILRGAFIRFVDLRYDEKSKVTYTKLNLSAAFSDTVREAMQWSELPSCFPSADLEGDLTASHLVMTPDGKELRQHEMQLDVQTVANFSVHRVKTGEDSTELELRFQVTTAQNPAEALAGSYLRAVGKTGSALRINYEQQEEMPLEEDKQERLITEDQAHDTSEETDEPEDGAPLAPAAVMGGTHQKRKPRQDRGTVN